MAAITRRAVVILSGLVLNSFIATDIFAETNFMSYNNIPREITPRDESYQEIQCLTDAVYYESRNQPTKGIKAVAHVILNRVSANFGKNVCDVIYKTTKKSCAFEWVCRNTQPKEKKDSEKWLEIYSLMENMYRNKEYDFTHGSLYFHSRNSEPYWVKGTKRVMQIGNHVFYKKAKKI